MRRLDSRHLILSVFLANPVNAAPVECLHNGEVIGTSGFASVENGLVTCQDPVTKIVMKESQFKNWMLIQDKLFKNGSLQKETPYDGMPGQNRYHGWRNTYSDGQVIKEELFEHGFLTLQRLYHPDGKLKLATATLASDRSQKSRVEFDREGLLTAINCSRAIIGPKQTKWCGLDGKESTVTVYANGVESKKLTFVDGHLKIYEHVDEQKIAASEPKRELTGFERIQTENYSDGHKKSEQRFSVNGKPDGIQRYFDRNSEAVVFEDLFDDGVLKESRIFYPNGRTKLHFVWEKTLGEKRFGNYRSFFGSGALESHGDCYELTEKIWPATFDALPTFLKNGITRNWDEDGEIREKSTWKDGERHGVTEYYFTRAGKTRMTKATYKNGESQTEQDFVESERTWKPLGDRPLKVSTAPKTLPAARQ